MYIQSDSKKVNQIYQSLLSTKDLYVSSILYGKPYTGKKTLAKKIYPKAVWVSGKDLEKVVDSLEKYDQVVITDFDEIINFDSINFNNKSIIAIYNGERFHPRLEDKFAFIYKMPRLSERSEDIENLINYFTQEAKELLNIVDDVTVALDEIDINEDFKSLKSSIYKHLLFKNISKDDLMLALSCYFNEHYDGYNIYKEMLEIFEKPLLKTGLKIYKSQLKLAEILGINRNTLRKKLNEYS